MLLPLLNLPGRLAVPPADFIFLSRVLVAKLGQTAAPQPTQAVTEESGGGRLEVLLVFYGNECYCSGGREVFPNYAIFLLFGGKVCVDGGRCVTFWPTAFHSDGIIAIFGGGQIELLRLFILCSPLPTPGWTLLLYSLAPPQL